MPPSPPGPRPRPHNTTLAWASLAAGGASGWAGAGCMAPDARTSRQPRQRHLHRAILATTYHMDRLAPVLPRPRPAAARHTRPDASSARCRHRLGRGRGCSPQLPPECCSRTVIAVQPASEPMAAVKLLPRTRCVTPQLSAATADRLSDRCCMSPSGPFTAGLWPLAMEPSSTLRPTVSQNSTTLRARDCRTMRLAQFSSPRALQPRRTCEACFATANHVAKPASNHHTTRPSVQQA